MVSSCLLLECVCRYWRDKLDTLIEFPIKYANLDTNIVCLSFCCSHAVSQGTGPGTVCEVTGSARISV